MTPASLVYRVFSISTFGIANANYKKKALMSNEENMPLLQDKYFSRLESEITTSSPAIPSRAFEDESEFRINVKN